METCFLQMYKYKGFDISCTFSVQMRASSGDNNMPGTLIQVTAAASVNAVGLQTFLRHKALGRISWRDCVLCIGAVTRFQ